jgi:hypothetical protein
VLPCHGIGRQGLGLLQDLREFRACQAGCVVPMLVKPLDLGIAAHGWIMYSEVILDTRNSDPSIRFW